MPAFIMIGSTIMPATSPGWASSARRTAATSLNGTIVVRPVIASGMPPLSVIADRRVRGADVLVDLGQHRDHHRVVVAVVAALDLEDPVAPGRRPHQVDRVHRGLGAGVAEAPQRLPEALGEVVRDDDGVLGGLGEVGAARNPGADRLDDRRMGVAGERDAVPAVEVGVLVAVDVVGLRAESVAEPHRVRLGDLPARRRPAGERARPLGHGLAGALPVQEGLRSRPR